MFPDTYMGGWRSREDYRKCCFSTQKTAFGPNLPVTENQWLAEEVPTSPAWLPLVLIASLPVWAWIVGVV